MLGLSNEKLLNIFIRLLAPVAKLALRNGLHVQELEECLKRAFLISAKNELEANESKATVSRLSIMTGIHRKDIDRLSNAAPTVKSEESLIARIVGHWQTVKEFQTKEGKPRVLTTKGEDSSFNSLVYSVSKELSPATVLFELERTGVAEKTENGVRLCKQSYSPDDRAEYGLSLLAEDCSDMTAAVEENLAHKHEIPNHHARTIFDNVRAEELDELRSWLVKEGHALHLKARLKLSRLDQDTNPKPKFKGKFVKVVLGTFSHIVFQNSVKDENRE